MIRIFLHLTFLFMVGSILGWVMELIFRRIVHKKWVNPGLLKGPYLPIYGIGLVILYIVAIFKLPIDSLVMIYILKTLAIGFLMTAVEYIAGVIFIRRMGLKLWDYSDRLYNYHGIICPLFSAIWTFLGAIYLLLLHNVTISVVNYYSTSFIYPFILGIFAGLFTIDCINTFKEFPYYKTSRKNRNIYVKKLHTSFEISEELLAIYKEEDFKK